MLNEQDTLSFHRCASVIPGIGAATIGKLENKAKEQGVSIMQVARKIDSGQLSVDKRADKFAGHILKLWSKDFKKNSPDAILLEMLQRFDYESYLNKNYKQVFTKKKDNLQALLNHAATYSKDNNADLARWLNVIMLTSDSDKESKENCVNLMTLHACKGLEFPIVYMAGVDRDVLPHKRALAEAKDIKEAIEEERRICYVGMTRAEEKLTMSYCTKRPRRDKSGYLKEEDAGASRFIKESGLLQ